MPRAPFFSQGCPNPNSLAVYRLQGDSTFWKEQHLYGSSRLGIYQYQGIIPAAPVVTNGTVTTLYDSLLMGNTSYELSNHLGNVLAVINDKKIGVSSISDSSLTDHYVADVLSLQDYYAFGSQMLGRSYQANKYRYGFNGKENDNEVKGEGNQQDYGMRIYDPRITRFLSVDPITKQYPELTPYQFASNRPIDGIDMDGLEYSPAGMGPNGPRESTSMKRVPLHPVVMQEINKQVQARYELINRYNNETILKADIFGRGYIGKREVVEDKIKIVKRDYYNAVGENISGGPFGAAGYYINGERGSLAGAALDQITFSFGGAPGEGFLSRPQTILKTNPGYEFINGIRAYSLSNVDARVWYLAKEATILSHLNAKSPLIEQAKQAFALRNQFRSEARILMADRLEAERLNRTDPNMTWSQVVSKYSKEGQSPDQLYQAIIDASTRSRGSVNEQLGLKKK